MEIFDKSSIKAAIRKSFSTVVYDVHNFSEESFIQSPVPEKWSPAEHIGHLVLSTKAVTKAMSLPPEMLGASFGKLYRPEMNFQETKIFYLKNLQEGMKSPEKYVFRKANEYGKDKMIQNLISLLNLLIEQLDHWTEQHLSSLSIQHPLLGNLSLREMLFFTQFHTEHHQKQINSETLSYLVPLTFSEP